MQISLFIYLLPRQTEYSVYLKTPRSSERERERQQNTILPFEVRSPSPSELHRHCHRLHHLYHHSPLSSNIDSIAIGSIVRNIIIDIFKDPSYNVYGC
jgi:hypothetical protein